MTLSGNLHFSNTQFFIIFLFTKVVKTAKGFTMFKKIIVSILIVSIISSITFCNELPKAHVEQTQKSTTDNKKERAKQDNFLAVACLVFLGIGWLLIHDRVMPAKKPKKDAGDETQKACQGTCCNTKNYDLQA